MRSWLVLALLTAMPVSAAPKKKLKKFPLPDLKKLAKSAKSGVPIGTSATSEDGTFTITLKARFQHYKPNPTDPNDHYDTEVESPKSAKFSPDGSKVYVNSLEGGATLIYDPKTLERIGLIEHTFTAENADLLSPQKPFDYRYEPSHAKLLARLTGTHDEEESRRPPRISGKPVEMEFTNGGKYLWASYYHWSFDKHSLDPSAVAVIDTSTEAIVAVLPSGPIPKYLAASPDGKWLAMVHWGDNTVGFVDISGGSTDTFKLADLVTIEHRLNYKPKQGKKIDRDKECGYCLRGSVFTADSKYLLVGRLSGGGIAVIDVDQMKYIGTAWGMRPTPRHLVLSKDGKTLYVSSNVGGYVSKFATDDIIAAAGTRHPTVAALKESKVGFGVRTIALSPDERWVYAAVNGESMIAALRASDLAVMAKVPVDSFPVGLACSPDNNQVWVTSQGRMLHGGNSVSIYEVSGSAVTPPSAVASGSSQSAPIPSTGTATSAIPPPAPPLAH